MGRLIEFRCYLKDSALVNLNKAHFERKEIGRMFDVVSLDFEYQEVEISTPSMIGVSFADVELLQYTGLKDRNGVKIFEGDILQLIGNYQGTLKAQILFKNAKFMMEVFYEHKNRCHAIHPYNLYWDVVGNIYENPELLNTTEGKNEND